MGTSAADVFVDVTDTFDRKVAALRAHTSQTAHFDDLAGFLRSWLARTAESAGWEGGRLAESFRRVDTGEARRPTTPAGRPA
jgi:LmbE family N-acetylglucosaminyl deacetylase